MWGISWPFRPHFVHPDRKLGNGGTAPDAAAACRQVGGRRRDGGWGACRNPARAQFPALCRPHMLTTASSTTSVRSARPSRYGGPGCQQLESACTPPVGHCQRPAPCPARRLPPHAAQAPLLETAAQRTAHASHQVGAVRWLPDVNQSARAGLRSCQLAAPGMPTAELDLEKRHKCSAAPGRSLQQPPPSRRSQGAFDARHLRVLGVERAVQSALAAADPLIADLDAHGTSRACSGLRLAGFLGESYRTRGPRCTCSAGGCMRRRRARHQLRQWPPTPSLRPPPPLQTRRCGRPWRRSRPARPRRCW